MAKAKEPIAEPVPEEPVAEVPVAETPVVETPETPAAPSYLDRVKGLGFADIETEEQARDRLLTAYEQTQAEQKRITEELERQKVYAKYGQEYLEGLRANPQQQPAATQPERKDWWAPPKYEAAVTERYREAKPDGSVGWKENTPAEIRVSTEAYQAYVENWAHKLATDPVNALKPFAEQIRAELEQVFEEKYKGYRQQETIEQFQERIRTDNDWLFEKDARTQQPVYERFSAEGQRMDALVSGAMQRFKLSLPDAWEYAKTLYDAEQSHVTTAAVSQQQTNQQVAATQKQKLLARGRGIGPNRNGSAPPETEPKARVQNPSLNAGKQFVEDLRAAGQLT